MNLNLKMDEKGTNLVHLIFANHNSLNLIFDFLPIILRIFKEAAGRIGEQKEFGGSTPGGEE